jgi:chemotaxis methyl-accepting protein methylase
MTGAALLTDADFAALTAKITRDRGFGCANYKDRCLRRRIAVRMRARGVHTYRDYARVLDGDAQEYERLLDALTINVTRFFRNPEAWSVLDAKVLAPVMDAGGAPLRVWSAGCASGEETYTLAILLSRRIAALGKGARACSVLGTDIDKASLEAAEGGRYGAPALLEMPPALRSVVFPGAAPFSVPAAVREVVRFARHDLLSDAPVGGPYDLIVCRNVTIYFDRPSQLGLLERFHDALRPGGALMLGKVETLLGPLRARFETVDARERIFRRVP